MWPWLMWLIQLAPRDPVADKEEAAARIREWLTTDLGRYRVRAGQVDPMWREAERRVGQAVAAALDGRLGRALFDARDLLEVDVRPRGGPTPRGVDPSVAARPENSRLDQVEACRHAWEQPRGWRRTVVEVLVDADGQAGTPRVLEPSGKRLLDRTAIEAVAQALGKQPFRDRRGAVRVRFAVEAGIGMALPAAVPVTDAYGRPQGATVGAEFVFDEVLKVFRRRKPFHPEVETRVELLEVTPSTSW